MDGTNGVECTLVMSSSIGGGDGDKVMAFLVLLVMVLYGTIDGGFEWHWWCRWWRCM